MAAVINIALPATVNTIELTYGATNEVSGGVKTLRSVGTMTGLSLASIVNHSPADAT